MPKKIIFLSFSILVTTMLAAQEIIQLPTNPTPGIEWNGGEKSYFSPIWQTDVVTNVSEPSMQIFKAPEDINTGTMVIVAPGGGLYAHSIKSEGDWVAEWLNKQGINAAVLKYRLVPTAEDGVAEITELGMKNPLKIKEEVGKVLPLSIEDGLNAISYVRDNAENLGVDPNKIGFMGFSAGGAVTMGVATYYQEANRPDFIVPVYAWTDAFSIKSPQADAPPMLLICATDDPLDLARGSIDLYNAWRSAGKTVGLHMYSRGGHGFGMRKQNLPSDSWIERFHEWALVEGLVKNR